MSENFSSTVSIVIPCYNYARYLEDAVNSVLNQTYPNIQIIIVDDASTDESLEIIKKIADSHKNVSFIENKTNQGVIYSRNIGIEKSLGEYILPLDADDIIEKTYIEKAVKILDTMPEVGMVYCDGNFIGDKNEKWNLPDFSMDDFLFCNCIFATALFRKDDFIKAGKYKDYMKQGLEDWDLWFSFLELGLKPYKIKEPLFNYRYHGNTSRSSQVNELIAKKEIFKHHSGLYAHNEKFLNKVFQKNKYKKLFNVFLIISIIEACLILISIIIMLFR